MLPLKNAIFQTEAVLGKVKWRCNPKKNTVHRCVLLNLPFFPIRLTAILLTNWRKILKL